MFSGLKIVDFSKVNFFLNPCRFLLLGFFLTFISLKSTAGKRYSVANGNWNLTSTWSATAGGASGASVPGINDTVYIQGPGSGPADYTVTVTDASAVCKALFIGGNAAKTRGYLYINANCKLMVSGNITIGGGFLNNTNRSGNLIFNPFSYLEGDSLILTRSEGNDPALNSPGTLNMANGGRLVVRALAVGLGSATWNYGTGTVVMKGNNTLPSTIFTTFNNFIDSSGTTTTPVEDTIIGNLEIKAAGNLSLGAPIYIQGDWNRNSGGQFTQNDYWVHFYGAKDAGITAFNGQAFSYLHLIKNRSNYLNLYDSISISQVMTIDSGILDLKTKNVTLISNASGTASFDKMGTYGSIAYSSTGRFIVERYIPTGTSSGRHPKAWQFLAVPTNGDGQTIKDAWQEGGSNNSNPKPGYGTQITSYYGTPAGFDMYTRAASLKTYKSSNDSWLEVSNTNATPAYNNKGYMIFVRGSRAVTSTSQNADSTILRTKGKLLTPANPPATITISANKFEAIGNPYACPVSFTNIYDLCSPSITNGFYTWDPSPNAGTYGLGMYQFHSYLYNYDGCAIQSGQAFFVYSTGSSGTLSFSEACKVPGSSLTGTMGNGGGNFNFFKYIPVDTSKQFLNISLFSKSLSSSNFSDAANLVFSPSFSNGYDVNDAVKMMNPGENLSIFSLGRNLTLECRNSISLQDTIVLSLTNLRQQSYRLRFSPRNMINNKMDAYLLDTYTMTEQPISNVDSTSVVFTVNGNPTSTGNRFKIFFKPKGTFMVLKENPKAGLYISQNSENSNDLYVFPNPATKGNTNIAFKNMPLGRYEILVLNELGQVCFTQTFDNYLQGSICPIYLRSLKPGNYLLKINSANSPTITKRLSCN